MAVPTSTAPPPVRRKLHIDMDFGEDVAVSARGESENRDDSAAHTSPVANDSAEEDSVIPDVATGSNEECVNVCGHREASHPLETGASPPTPRRQSQRLSNKRHFLAYAMLAGDE